jgi:addiction module HigA family antidote
MADMPPTDPGEILREEFLVPLNLTAYAVAKAIGMPRTRISEIVHERRSITADTAVRLCRFFRTSPEFWMNLQARYDLESVLDAHGAEIEASIRPIALSASD